MAAGSGELDLGRERTDPPGKVPAAVIATANVAENPPGRARSWTTWRIGA